MTATLITTSPVTPKADARVRGSGFDPAKKVQLALDGSGYTTNYFRPQDDGTFQVGMLVGSKARTSTITARYAGSSAIVATVSLVIATPTPVPTPVPTPTPAPTPTPPPVNPPPLPGPEPSPALEDWQAAVDNAKDGDVLDFSSTVYRKQLEPKNKVGLTLRGGLLQGDGKINDGILALYCTDLIVELMTIQDWLYAGFLGIGPIRNKVRRNTIQRIGKVAYDKAVAAGGIPTDQVPNSYGAAMSGYSGDARLPVDCEITDNVIDWVPWEAIDAHGGKGLLIARNTITHSNRPIRIMEGWNKARITDTIIEGNLISLPTPREDVLKTYPYNEVAISAYLADRVSGTGNVADGFPAGNAWQNIGNTCTGVTIQVTAKNPK